MAEFTITITSATGQSKVVKVTMTGATLAEVLDAAKIQADAVNVSVDGKPVGDLSTHHVNSGSKIVLTERVSGS